MRDKIYTYLRSQKMGATSKELVEQVLKIKGATPNISEKLIQTAIAGDRRFAVDEHHLWKVMEESGTPLSKAAFVLLSFLTIDTPERYRIIVEISAQKLRGGKIIDRFHTLVNPGSLTAQAAPLPADFAHEIEDGVPLGKAVRALFDFFGEAILVGYDIHASINQLNMILNRLNETVENPPLCLKFLAKKLIPGLQPKSISDIAAFYKLPVVDTCRTEREICTIAEIFSRYTEQLKKLGCSTVEEVLAFQYPEIGYVDFSKYAFDKGFLWAIPQKPGIYKMRSKNGDIIYVGKAKNLKQRLSSYFWNTADRLQKITDLLNNVYTIEYEEAGSELAAMLMEYQLIKKHRPRLNQQLEVHERPSGYGNLRNFIVILPSSFEGSLELFFVKDGLPLQRYEILKEAVNFSGVERILDENIKDDNTLTDIERGEMEIVLSWVETNKDQVNYINMDTVTTKEARLKLLKDYMHDEETPQKKHFRSS
ncbi:MAG: GIY-YIG nuclease family protein [Planctomycetes bacterium]|nr:GIY-YIG nuclease family protein [Planctomycetota bacterium]